MLGIVQTSIAQIMLFKLIARQGASFFAQVNYFVPVFGVLWGWLALSEQLPAQAQLALAVILSGLTIVRIWGADDPRQPTKPRAAMITHPLAHHRKKRRKHARSGGR